MEMAELDILLRTRSKVRDCDRGDRPDF